jgi:predicted RNA methylase
MQKWQNTGAGKIQAKRFNEALNSLRWENNTFVELSGVVGQSERRSVLSVMGGSNDDRADVTEAQERIGERFGWIVTAKNVNEIIEAVKAETVILQQNRPVHDERTTPDAEAERRAKFAQMAAEQKAKGDQAAAAFITHYGSGEKIFVQPGQVAVVAQVCFDNSDSMSDYFDRHASLSQPFVLMVVAKQAETEKLARRGAAVSALLSGVEFEWHTEKYSMGHGNYLESKGGFELPLGLQNIRTRNGSGITRAHWEITFQTAYREPLTLDAFAGYGQDPQPTTDPGKGNGQAVTDAAITENEEKNGIEIRFPSKPSSEVLETLKANGWRWSRFSSCWYTKRSDVARQFAASLFGSIGAEGGTQAEGPKSGATTTAPAVPVRFHTWADAMQPKIDHAGRSMTQNPTPKRNREYQSRMHDCRNMERTQKALRALADAHLSGLLPESLAGLKTREEIAAMVRKSTTGGGGYYSVIECPDYAVTTPAARILQGMIEGNSEERAERERLRKIESLEAEVKLTKIPGFFPTQPRVIAIMLDRARLEDGALVLEPSAGNGNIADAVKANCPRSSVHCFEYNLRLSEILKLKGYDLIGSDFMEDIPVAPIYDRVVMNPPFEKQQDIDHVRKAFSMLKPGGLLVSVMAPGFEFRQDRKSSDFRAWLDENGGTWEDLPDGAFKASGTGISTRLVVIER